MSINWTIWSHAHEFNCCTLVAMHTSPLIGPLVMMHTSPIDVCVQVNWTTCSHAHKINCCTLVVVQAPVDQDFLSSVFECMIERERSIPAHSYALSSNSPTRSVSGRQFVAPCADVYVHVCKCI